MWKMNSSSYKVPIVCGILYLLGYAIVEPFYLKESKASNYFSSGKIQKCLYNVTFSSTIWEVKEQ